MLFALAVLCMAIGAQAWTFTTATNPAGATVPAGTDWTVPFQVNTVGGNFFGHLSTLVTETHPISGSVVKWAENVIVPTDGFVTDNWLAAGTPANFEFDVDVSPTNTPGITGSRHRITVFGRMTGTGSPPADIGYTGSSPFSNTKWTADSMYDNTTSTAYPFISGTLNPNNGLEAVYASLLIDGLTVPLNIWINHIQDVPGPTNNPLSISGYINAVPEPNALALLVGMGISGSAFLFRRRRS